MTNETQKQLENSFLARVPEFIAQGKSIDEAIKLAFEQEMSFIGEMHTGTTKRSKLAREVLANDVFIGINNRESAKRLEAINAD